MPADIYSATYVDLEGQLYTYSAIADDYVPYTAATNMMVLSNPAGSNTMIRITEVRISGKITASAPMDLYLQVRTAIDTGGTPTTLTSDKHDSNDPTAQGVCVTQAAVPTMTGTLFQLRGDLLVLPAASTPVTPVAPIIWQFGMRGGAKCPRLRPGQQIAISNNGNAVGAGTSLYMSIEWTETQPVQ